RPFREQPREAFGQGPPLKARVERAVLTGRTPRQAERRNRTAFALLRAPSRNRTGDLPITSGTLWPTELSRRGREAGSSREPSLSRHAPRHPHGLPRRSRRDRIWTCDRWFWRPRLWRD